MPAYVLRAEERGLIVTDRHSPSTARVMVSDETYERLKARIMDHDIAPGARLSIDGLTRELGVSQTPIRESLARLESEGLVVKVPLRGYRATELLTEEEFTDLFDLRGLLEPWAARRAAERVTDAAARALRTEVESVHPPEREGYESYQALAAHDERLHHLVWEQSGSRQVLRALSGTHCHLHIFRLHWELSFGPGTLREHRRIVEAIAEGDAVAAERAMAEHLEGGGPRGRLRGYFTD